MFVVFHQAVVLGVEDGVDGGQANIFIAAAVAGDEMTIQQLVVVGAGCLRHHGRIVGTDRQGGVEIWIGQ